MSLFFGLGGCEEAKAKYEKEKANRGRFPEHDLAGSSNVSNPFGYLTNPFAVGCGRPRDSNTGGGFLMTQPTQTDLPPKPTKSLGNAIFLSNKGGIELKSCRVNDADEIMIRIEYCNRVYPDNNRVFEIPYHEIILKVREFEKERMAQNK